MSKAESFKPMIVQPSNTVEDILNEMKFGRPAETQMLIDKWINEANQPENGCDEKLANFCRKFVDDWCNGKVIKSYQIGSIFTDLEMIIHEANQLEREEVKYVKPRPADSPVIKEAFENIPQSAIDRVMAWQPQTIKERALDLYPDEAYRNAIEVRKAYIKGATDKDNKTSTNSNGIIQIVIERVIELKNEASENADKAIDGDPKKIDIDKVSNFWVGSEHSYNRVLQILNAL